MQALYFFALLITGSMCLCMEKTDQTLAEQFNMKTNCSQKYDPNQNALEQLIHIAITQPRKNFLVIANNCRELPLCEFSYIKCRPKSKFASVTFSIPHRAECPSEYINAVQSAIDTVEEIPFKAYKFVLDAPPGKVRKINIHKFFDFNDKSPFDLDYSSYNEIHNPKIVDAGKYGQMICYKLWSSSKIVCATMEEFKAIYLKDVKDEEKDDNIYSNKIKNLIYQFTPGVASLFDLSLTAVCSSINDFCDEGNFEKIVHSLNKLPIEIAKIVGGSIRSSKLDKLIQTGAKYDNPFELLVLLQCCLNSNYLIKKEKTVIISMAQHGFKKLTDCGDCFHEIINANKLHASAVKLLNLSHNKIQAVREKTFNFSNNIRVLDLSHNKIKQVDEKAFAGLNQVEKIILSHNKIKTLDTKIFKHMPFLSSVELEENPMDCGEQKKIKDALEKHFPLDRKMRREKLKIWSKKSWYKNRYQINNVSAVTSCK
jgi:hypothetical protein